ncbi:MAG: GH3 auxin-responsive promoter family protein [Chitinophagaceae bacterium]|nr:GH3 auxin-responsive promoter family protein [Chitinophagaceae bacterium]
MKLLGTFIKKSILFRKRLENKHIPHKKIQENELKKLLFQARNTSFGKKYNFTEILENANNNLHFCKVFQDTVPIFDYESIYNNWWAKQRLGEQNITCKGKIKYFAMSSGTASASSKYIPVTRKMQKSINKSGIKQFLTLLECNLPDNFFTKQVLMLGGSTALTKNSLYKWEEGDLSGITASNLPAWFQRFYKPGKKIAKIKDWNTKIDAIVENATKWDIGIIAGVPSWVQILLERIIKHYKLKTIHDIWPHLEVFAYGGVSIDPYRKSFEKFFSKKILYIQTYLASEGFIAIQEQPYVNYMKLIMDNGIFYEFIPFNENNFSFEGDILENPQVLKIDEIKEQEEYALLITTNAGAWRYLIGDTLKFVSKKNADIIITGRTKHFMSVCGEHVSVENMNTVIQTVAEELKIEVREFTLTCRSYEGFFAHLWYIGTEKNIDISENTFRDMLDTIMKDINDDYRVERESALKEVFVKFVPYGFFYEYMKLEGKEGGQSKFPRVLKKEKLEKWTSFLDKKLYS